MKRETVYYNKLSLEDFDNAIQAKIKSGAIVVHSDIHYTCNPARHVDFKVFGIVTFEIEDNA